MTAIKICGLMLVLSTPLVAAELDQGTIERRNMMCDATFILAKKIMTNRQNGVDMPAMIKMAEGNRITELLTIAAFDVPIFAEVAKPKAIVDFSNEHYSDCLKAFEPEE